jgi:hypothetical protein
MVQSCGVETQSLLEKIYPVTKVFFSSVFPFEAKANTIASKNAINGIPNFKILVLII